MQIKKVTLLLLLIILTSCGYHLVGSGGLQKGIKNVAVLPFEKVDNVYILDQRLTEAVRAELGRRAKVKILESKEGADAILYGSITNFSTFPISYGSDGRANRYKVSVVVKVILKDKDGKEIFKMEGYRFEEDYERSSKENSFFSTENISYDALSKDLAKAIISAIFETNL